jgi:hypothetical protein
MGKPSYTRISCSIPPSVTRMACAVAQHSSQQHSPQAYPGEFTYHRCTCRGVVTLVSGYWSEVMQAWAFKNLNRGSNREVTSRSRRQEPISFGLVHSSVLHAAHRNIQFICGRVSWCAGKPAGKMRATSLDVRALSVQKWLYEPQVGERTRGTLHLAHALTGTEFRDRNSPK